MCQIFGYCGRRDRVLNKYLKEFYSGSSQHPNGWGLALLDGNNANIEKEPIMADKSIYLKHRLNMDIYSSVVLAHIRYATIGNIDINNCHPFTAFDDSGRRWTLIHNGTIFDFTPMDRFAGIQVGDTDSERILLYIISVMNEHIHKEEYKSDVNRNFEQITRQHQDRDVLHDREQKRSRQRELSGVQRMEIMEDIFNKMSYNNKLNLIIYDGAYMYVHSNLEESLHYYSFEDGVMFSSVALFENDLKRWKAVPVNRLHVYEDGGKIYEGAVHNNEYHEDPEEMKKLFMAYSGL